MSQPLTVATRITGGETIQANFRNLAKKVAGSIVKKSVRSGIAPMNRALRSATEYADRTGRLRKSFRVTVTSKQNGLITRGKTTTAVKSNKSTRAMGRAGYSWLVEHGHRVGVGQSGRPEKGVVLRRRDKQAKRWDETYGTSGGIVRGRFYGRNAFRRSHASALSTFERKYFGEVLAAVKS